MASDERTDPLADMFNLFAAPLAGTIRSVEQFRKGVDEFLNGVENFNRTMENLNETAERINSLLAEVEEPIRIAVPQVTRTVKAADDMMQVVSGPAMAAAPGLAKLAETLSTPAFAQLPNQISQFSQVLTDVSTRMAPLSQLAESAGGLFGGIRLPGVPGSRPSAPRAEERGLRVETTDLDDEASSDAPGSGAASAKQPAAKKRAAKKATSAKRTKKQPAKKTAAKKSAATRRSS